MNNNQMKHFLSKYKNFKIGDIVKCSHQDRIYINIVCGEILFITGPYLNKSLRRSYYIITRRECNTKFR